MILFFSSVFLVVVTIEFNPAVTVSSTSTLKQLYYFFDQYLKILEIR